ncbi:MAG: T9SS type A sorting domain-containing protein, partial [Candidatus Cloacimonetes bacterium]|nr:T9SS type A sorting domain-containing protein [Candidatus Cloacimonadota bacterium]
DKVTGIDNYLGYHFLQTADIDAAETRYWQDGRGFQPIGHTYFLLPYHYLPFSGYYDGNHFKISNLHINAPEPERDVYSFWAVPLGLFGDTNQAILKNIHLENTQIATIIDNPSWEREISTVRGALAGRARDTKIHNCSSSGKISGETIYNDPLYVVIGGLVGACNFGSITNSYSTVTIYNLMGEEPRIGGLAGFLYDSMMTNSYFNGIIHIEEEDVMYGALVGINKDSKIQYCYATSYASDLNMSNLIGLISPTSNDNIVPSIATNNFWDIETTKIRQDVGSNLDPDSVVKNNFGVTTSEMNQAATFIDNGWDFEEIWDIDPEINNGYPFLRSIPPPENPEDPSSDFDFTIIPLLSSFVYPNPVRSEVVTIVLSASTTTHKISQNETEISIYNIRGQLVRRSSDSQSNEGNTLFVWDRKDMNNHDVPSGVYFYRIQMNDEITSGRFLVIR